eukprot:TRINITY_DN35996_c0_g1_i1.p2 TRINITY_DN35996_c0_g1~~TRINITY_DN35996_c0_g1_i1.p2  ORF type:complete len:195 (+),score=60.16 TRINITY_DN35996_c0_g1_i1:33-587(+)
MVVLVTGPSGSGKSTLAAEMRSRHAGTAAALRQDDYFAGAFVPYSERADDALERPEQVDWGRLLAAVADSRQGADLVLVEGHAVLASADLLQLAGAVVYLDAPEAVCRERRLLRSERPPAETAALGVYFTERVWPAHERTVAPVVQRLQDAADPRLLVLSATAAEVRPLAEAALRHLGAVASGG